MKINNKTLIIAAIISILMLYFTFKTDYQRQIQSADLTEFLQETPDLDYSNEKIQKLANDLKTDNEKKTIRTVASFVVNNIQYDSKVSLEYCYEEKASTVLKTRKGDCVSMSKLLTAILRAQGIPARTVGGCLSNKRQCIRLLSVKPPDMAKTTPMAEMDFKKRGFLHEWVEVYTSSGWILVEATTGNIFSTNCNTYTIFKYDNNPIERCEINDKQFWNFCYND